MAPLEQVDQDAIATNISHSLSETPYACSSLVQLAGGSANFVYRGILVRPFPNEDGSMAMSVVVKHSTDFVAINRDFPLDVTRCMFEECMLNAVGRFSPSHAGDTLVRTPRLHLFDRRTNTQVLEDVPEAEDLKSAFFSSHVEDLLPGASALTVGQQLGSWLRSFHLWTSAPEQAVMRAVVGRNQPMRDLKFMVTYGGFVKVLGNYPELLEGCQATLELIRDAMAKEFSMPPGYDDEDWGIIHGDYWSGNVLIPKTPWRQPGAGTNKLFVIDWEFAQFGHRAFDLGQMIGDLYERKIFNDIDIVMPAMRGVIEGYGALSPDMAFRAAIHAGVHLIGWYTRRDPTAPLTAPPETVVAGLATGRDFILKGWQRDRAFFECGVLAPLFAPK